MSRIDRAAQFAPFAALTGYDAAVAETARLTTERAELDEDAKTRLNSRLQLILKRIEEQPEIDVTYFKPDDKKAGGAYFTASGKVKQIDEYKRALLFSDGIKIPLDDIYCIEGKLFVSFDDN